ncbi:MAG TPA: peptidoglycan-associated lipoprotein Pal [Candidatus Angelobacter sp.]|nr:peptidoglycan-associated lipoprotein Pal [Candidatus Angelobacter sp.]
MNNRKQQWILAVVLASLLALVIGCGKKKQPPPPPPPPPKPPTATLSANPTSIQRGQSATLTWSTDNASDITLDGNKVDASGSQSVSPTNTTTYHLNAKGAGGSQDATATVNVAEPPPPTPTPAPPPSLTDDQLLAQALTEIFFDFDKSDLRPEAQQALSKAAPVITAHPTWQVRIEGNADERGSSMYNLALGDRRANAAQQALVQAGVPASQLKTVSYGKEKPVCTESNEDCWQKNRRDAFVLVH